MARITGVRSDRSSQVATRWEPTKWERWIGILGAGGIICASGSFALATFLDSDSMLPALWFIPLMVSLASLFLLARLLWTRERGLSKLAFTITASLFLCAGVVFAYVATLSSGSIRTGYLGSVAIVCVWIGAHNLTRLWKGRQQK